ncbi:serine hydrolase [Streptomyces sp. NPDC001601]|uniref:serine hydrolase n=1 Tax=Streptomyces sp. NPDC001601 TaxID=3364592 RepID=UPI0036B90447
MVRTAHGDVRSVEEASVAGESPDRSKQRESSAEPTPGSAESVPEARDPRLAVAAGKETSGGVDTATRIFSVRDLKTAEKTGETDETDETDEPGETGKGDAKLRDAVAAWVRTGEPAEDAEDATAPEAATEAGDGPEAPAGTGRAQRAQEPPESAATTATAPEATTEDTPAAPENAPEPQDAAPRHESAPEAKPATTELPEAKPADKSATTTEPEDAAPQDDPATPEKPQAAKPQGKSAATGDAEDAAPEDKPKATAEPEDAKPQGKPTTTADPEDAAPEGKPKATAEPEDAKPQGKPATTADPAPEDKPEGKPTTTADPQDAAPEGKPKATAEPEDAKPQGKSAATADPEDKPEAAEEPEDGAPAGESEADDEPEDAVPADRPGAGGEPADADGEEGPQGPPAPGDDGRTGGAGGKTGGGEGEAEPAVDQPTTMLKAPRPPQVDQPTTTLKLGAGTTEAERTSKFVALKSDIKQGPKPTAKPDAEPDAKPDAKPEPASTTRTTVIPQVGPERTTQQPLPPKPPLDLLAELTNTPPPPETPVRTLFRRVKIWTPLVIVLLIVFAVVQTLRPLPQPTLDLTAKDTYTFDGSRTDMPWPADGQAALDVQGIGTFGSSGDQKPVPIASVAKVMTAYIVLRDHPLKSGAAGPKIKIDQAAQDQANAGQESTVGVTAGDSITQREALESILIASANNVARLLARWDAGSEKSFVAKMNATAKQLGMTNTTYTDPSGLTNSTVSTAVDQVKLAKAAMASEPSFREVAAMMSYDDYKGVNHGNWNQLVGRNNVVGIKTGTTTSALGNLVFAAKKDVNGETRTIIGAVIRQPASAAPDKSILTAALNAGDKLIRAAQGALKSATIYKKGDVVGSVDDGLGGRTPVVATEDVTAVGWSGLKVKLSFAADDVPHTAKAGTKVGTLTVGDGSGSAVQVPVALAKDLAEPGFTSRLTRLG